MKAPYRKEAIDKAFAELSDKPYMAPHIFRLTTQKVNSIENELFTWFEKRLLKKLLNNNDVKKGNLFNTPQDLLDSLPSLTIFPLIKFRQPQKILLIKTSCEISPSIDFPAFKVYLDQLISIIEQCYEDFKEKRKTVLDFILPKRIKKTLSKEKTIPKNILYQLNSRIGIFGDWGSGKTSLIRNIQLELLIKHPSIKPLLLDVTDYKPEELEYWFAELYLLESLKDNPFRMFTALVTSFLGNLAFKVGLHSANVKTSGLNLYSVGKKGVANRLLKNLYFEQWQDTLKRWLNTSQGYDKLLFSNPRFSSAQPKMPVVVFDNLDRCSFDQQVKLLRAIAKNQDFLKIPILACLDDRQFMKTMIKKSHPESDLLQKALPIPLRFNFLNSNDYNLFSQKLLVQFFNQYQQIKNDRNEIVESVLRVIESGPSLSIRYLKVLLSELKINIDGFINLSNNKNNKEVKAKILGSIFLVVIKNNWIFLFRYFSEFPGFLNHWLRAGFQLKKEVTNNDLQNDKKTSEDIYFFFRSNTWLVEAKIPWEDLLQPTKTHQNKFFHLFEKFEQQREHNNEILKENFKKAWDEIKKIHLSYINQKGEDSFSRYFFRELQKHVNWLVKHRLRIQLINLLSFWENFFLDESVEKNDRSSSFKPENNCCFQVLRLIGQFVIPDNISHYLQHQADRDSFYRLIRHCSHKIDKSGVNNFWHIIQHCYPYYYLYQKNEVFCFFFKYLLNAEAVSDIRQNSELAESIVIWLSKLPEGAIKDQVSEFKLMSDYDKKAEIKEGLRSFVLSVFIHIFSDQNNQRERYLYQNCSALLHLFEILIYLDIDGVEILESNKIKIVEFSIALFEQQNNFVSIDLDSRLFLLNYTAKLLELIQDREFFLPNDLLDSDSLIDKILPQIKKLIKNTIRAIRNSNEERIPSKVLLNWCCIDMCAYIISMIKQLSYNKKTAVQSPQEISKLLKKTYNHWAESISHLPVVAEINEKKIFNSIFIDFFEHSSIVLFADDRYVCYLKEFSKKLFESLISGLSYESSIVQDTKGEIKQWYKIFWSFGVLIIDKGFEVNREDFFKPILNDLILSLWSYDNLTIRKLLIINTLNCARSYLKETFWKLLVNSANTEEKEGFCKQIFKSDYLAQNHETRHSWKLKNQNDTNNNTEIPKNLISFLEAKTEIERLFDGEVSDAEIIKHFNKLKPTIESEIQSHKSNNPGFSPQETANSMLGLIDLIKGRDKLNGYLKEMTHNWIRKEWLSK